MEQFKEAKRLYQTKQYNLAISAFSELTDDPDLGSYASFYYALASHEEGYHQQSLSMMKQLLQRYPRWDKIQEVLYWAAHESFEQKNYEQGVQYLISLEGMDWDQEQSQKLLKYHLEDLNIGQLESLYDKFPEHEQIAFYYATKIYSQPAGVRNTTRLAELTDKFQFEILELINTELENEFKEKYTIAAVLPFMYTSLSNPIPVMRNRLVMDLYQGMKLAVEELNSKGNSIELVTFDTKKSGEVTSRFLDELEKVDLIVGPLYPGPVEVISKFSSEKKINMINPLTENDEYMGDNPFAFLFKPSYQTSAKKLAEWAKVNIPEDKRSTVVYFDRTERDSLFAQQYVSIIEEDSFDILDFRSLDDIDSKELLDILVEQYEEIYEKEVADSIAEISGRFIKFRKMRKEEEEDEELELPYFYDEEDEEREDKLIAYENKFVIRKDSIHHIMLAARSNVVANNIISAVASRGDSIMLYGYSNWLDFKTTNYQQLEDLEVQMVYPGYIDRHTFGFEEVESLFKASCNVVPSEYHYMGYELIHFLGNALKNYGKYFQTGFSENSYFPGKLSDGFSYKGANDNQIVPIVMVKDLEIKSINKEDYAN